MLGVSEKLFVCALLILLLFCFVHLPIRLIRIGVRRMRAGNRGVVSCVCVAVGCFVLGYFLYVEIGAYRALRPFNSKILASGFSPDGREYAVMQKWQDVFDPYEVTAYVRAPDGVWYPTYLGEGCSWRTVRVAFDGDVAMVYNDGELMFALDMPGGEHADVSGTLWGGAPLPAELTKHEVFQIYKTKR